MKLEKIPISASEERRAWELFTVSPARSVLHNELVKEILSLRDKLEAAPSDKFIETQLAIKAHRFLLGLIHRNDSLPTK